MRSRLTESAGKGIALIGCVIAVFLTMETMRYTIVHPIWGDDFSIEKDSLLGNLVWMVLFLVFSGLIARICRRISRRVLYGIAAVTACAVTVFLCYLITVSNCTTLVGDWLQVLCGSDWILNGDYESIGSYGYFVTYPYQLKLAQYFASIASVMGRSVWDSVVIFQYINAVMVGITYFLGGLITEELSKDTGAVGVYYIAGLFFAPMFLYCLFVYGDVPGTFGAVTAVCCYLMMRRYREQGKKVWLAYGIAFTAALAFACVMRSVFLIVGIAALCCELAAAVKTRRVRPLLWLCVSLAAVLGLQSLYGRHVLAKSGLDEQSGAPAVLWIAMGMQGGSEIADAPGGYNGYNLVTYEESGCSAEIASRQAWQDIRARLEEWKENPGKMFSFLKNKILNQWAEPTYGVFASTYYFQEPPEWVESLWNGESYGILWKILDGFQSVGYLCVLLYGIRLLRNNSRAEGYLPVLIFIGGFLFSALWEAKSRYIYPYAVMLLPCAACGAAAGLDELREGIGIVIKGGTAVIRHFHKSTKGEVKP